MKAASLNSGNRKATKRNQMDKRRTWKLSSASGVRKMKKRTMKARKEIK